MTLAPNTIEEQLNEFKQQFIHSQEIIEGLTELTCNQRQIIERRDKTICEINEKVDFKDRELERMEIALSDLRMKLVAAECRACKCDPDVVCGC